MDQQNQGQQQGNDQSRKGGQAPDQQKSDVGRPDAPKENAEKQENSGK